MARLKVSGRLLAWVVPVVTEAAVLARSIVFAWAIGPDELGRAMMLALTVRLVEMVSDVGIDRLLVQAPDGECARLQSELHGTAMLRGGVCALMLVALAPVMAALFSDGPSASAYAVLAIIPLLRGAVHLDYRRVERSFHYVKLAIVEGSATLAMAISVLPAVWVFSDHRAMSVVLVCHAIAYALLSHFVADRPYALKLSTTTLRRAWVFGAPLILNAGLLFLTFYADRLIVAQAYSWTALALYAVAVQLALLPAQIVGRAAASLVLPALRLALVQGDPGDIWKRCLLVHVALACAMAAGFAIVAPPAIALVYGEAFRPDTALAVALALAAGFRILRTPFSQLAVATGRTGDPARANIIRMLALIPIAVFAAAGLPLAAIAAAAALGEAGATLRAYQLSLDTPVSLKPKEAYS
ncbi:MAG: oligosaccharide flippase family protein [Roseobacter sp.]